MLFAKFTVLTEFDTIWIVFLILHSIVISLLALCAC